MARLRGPGDGGTIDLDDWAATIQVDLTVAEFRPAGERDEERIAELREWERLIDNCCYRGIPFRCRAGQVPWEEGRPGHLGPEAMVKVHPDGELEEL